MTELTNFDEKSGSQECDFTIQQLSNLNLSEPALSVILLSITLEEDCLLCVLTTSQYGGDKNKR